MLDALGIAAQSLVVVAFFAFLAERLTDLLVKPWVPEDYKGPVAVGSTMALGLAAAVAFRLDIINSLLVAGGIGDPLNEWVSVVTTGLIVGGGSQLVHDLWPGSTAKTKPYLLGLQDVWADTPDLDPEGMSTFRDKKEKKPKDPKAEPEGMSSFRDKKEKKPKDPEENEPEGLQRGNR